MRLSNGAFNNIPYKRMHLTSKVNLTKRFSEKYKYMRLTTRLYSSYVQQGKAGFQPLFKAFNLTIKVAVISCLPSCLE